MAGVALTTLMNERLAIGGGIATGFQKLKRSSTRSGFQAARRSTIERCGQSLQIGMQKCGP